MLSHLFRNLVKQKNRKIKELLEITTERLKKNNIEDARLNAEILLSHVLGTEREKLYISDIEINREKESLFLKLIEKRGKRIPLQYLTGKVNFYGYLFWIKKGIFIPRPETEILVEETIKIYKNFFYPEKVNILDIGTGCGNIAIVLAKEIEK